MLSYEDIFRRHHTRPLSILTNRYLDTPPVVRRIPFALRSPLLVKRPRPLSTPDLDDIPSILFDRRKPTEVSKPKTLLDDTPSILFTRHKPTEFTKPKTLLDNTPSILFTRHKPTEVSKPKTLPPAPRVSNDNYKLGTTFPDRHLTRRELPLCTPDDLLEIILEPTGYYALPTDPWNEVYPDIYISDAPTALCTSVLKQIGITHVLNAAQGKEKGCGQVNTWPGFYRQSGIRFLGVPAFDNIVFRIHPYFEEAAEFIDDGLKSGGKVLVHCRCGISRSATLVCAFLMMKKGLTVQEAVRTVRKNRAIIPNDGFLKQLCDLNDKLKRKPKLY